MPLSFMNLITSLGVLGSFSVLAFFRVVAPFGVMASSREVLEYALGPSSSGAATSDSRVRFEEWPASYKVSRACIFSRWNKGRSNRAGLANQTIASIRCTEINLINGRYTNCFALERFRGMNRRDHFPEHPLSVELFQHECFAAISIPS